MSYQNMDHAAWVQMSNAAINKQGRKSAGLPEVLTDFQAKVCDILGMVFGGVYNAPINWQKVEWNYGRGVSVVAHSPQLATFDFGRLTSLVFLCHEARIRCEIDPAGPRGMRLSFWPRIGTGGMGERHPNLDEAVAAFRGYLPTDHRILYRDTILTTPPGEQRGE